ncbi:MULTISPECIES: bifunctional 3-(3-hydroxy-phenyl)propionate/3-hydroxycinnamic acid hydroxylase [unclassified Burkholderia]|uniref:bifunctional 3-(3-hydroxy-phenyl)propionate/3-hydroxycinnamic acid hydroxylase n=1 Tax=unclassified Burkholderia TaxID=2613784 RepID=UPI001E59AD03|nr:MULTISPECIES: bifunctional 3-(3-hydroxy-phenyl)propionate/3-hydroxycinnamic acid hydroxylase [unclassified Burkholderia]UEP29603.1 bifunctional 3-(3-hydroxy-phenyl)propionate/3-hydroxycinnamic acid hydroxylase [Burkholderia sp. B21-007]UEP45083.1 bifunctional 3-(3-hydroxy-phenyl)propionate/3-hydroxycinnamic acid hydroxylase [Burkholderia sp. B21-005]
MNPSPSPTTHRDRRDPLSTDVAIIGAGPVGLMIANILGLQGVRVTLIEKLERIIDYPRAIGLDDEALRVFQSIGLADELVPHTTPDHWMRFVTKDGHCFASIEPRTDEFGWPRRNAFIQPLADRVLHEGLARFPHVQVLFAHSVASFTQDADGVSIDVDDADGERRTVRAAYMVGADGGNSFVRRVLNVPFEGRTKPNQWIVVDVRNDPIGSPHIYLHCDHERPYVSAALPHGIRRFEFMVMPGETEEELSKPENMAALIRKVVADPDAVDYIRKRVYTHNARLASTFHVGRILLAGDAAHIMPVWQGQGYNSGIRDANNLGWKLAMVARGLADSRLLETYTVERRAHARSMIHLSEVAGDIFAPTTRFGARFRDTFVRALTLFPAVKRYFVEMRFKPMPRYEAGAVLLPAHAPRRGWLARVLERSGNSAPGRLLGLMSEKRDSLIGRLAYGRDPFAASPVGRMFIQPRVRLPEGRTVLLDDAIGTGFVLLGWGADPTFGMTPQARALWARIGGRFVIAKPDAQLAYADDVPSDVLAIGDETGRLKDWFSRLPESVVLLRPDRFVAGVCAPQQVSSAIVALAEKLGVTGGARHEHGDVAPSSQGPVCDRDVLTYTAGA